MVLMFTFFIIYTFSNLNMLVCLKPISKESPTYMYLKESRHLEKLWLKYFEFPRQYSLSKPYKHDIITFTQKQINYLHDKFLSLLDCASNRIFSFKIEHHYQDYMHTYENSIITYRRNNSLFAKHVVQPIGQECMSVKYGQNNFTFDSNHNHKDMSRTLME